jgi:hypothetical protein
VDGGKRGGHRTRVGPSTSARPESGSSEDSSDSRCIDSTTPNTLAPFTLEIVIAAEDAERIEHGYEDVLPEPLEPGSDAFFRHAP